MSFLVSEELSFRIPVELRYETCDPYAVRLTFHLPGDAPVTWAFGRELLIDGVGRPCGDGDVQIAPDRPRCPRRGADPASGRRATRRCSAPVRRRWWPSSTARTSWCRWGRSVPSPTSTPTSTRRWTAFWRRNRARADGVRRQCRNASPRREEKRHSRTSRAAHASAQTRSRCPASVSACGDGPSRRGSGPPPRPRLPQSPFPVRPLVRPLLRSAVPCPGGRPRPPGPPGAWSPAPRRPDRSSPPGSARSPPRPVRCWRPAPTLLCAIEKSSSSGSAAPA